MDVDLLPKNYVADFRSNMSAKKQQTYNKSSHPIFSAQIHNPSVFCWNFFAAFYCLRAGMAPRPCWAKSSATSVIEFLVNSSIENQHPCSIFSFW